MIRILTDSTCDLSPQRQKELGVEVVPLRVYFGTESFRDGVDMTNADFYARLRKAEELPHTSQPGPEDFVARLQPWLDQGDQVLGIFISSRLSGTLQSAQIAAELLGAKDAVRMVESTTVTFGLGLLVEMAARLRDEGRSLEAIAQGLEALIPRLRLYAAMDTLKYLKMGGRVSSATALVGGVLGITPILNVRDGVVEAAAKARGRKGAFQWMEARLAQEPADLSYPVAFGHTDDPVALAQCQAWFQPLFPGGEFLQSEIGCVVGTHAGPGAAGFAYFVRA